MVMIGIIESPQGLNWNSEASNRTLQSKGLKVNVKKTKAKVSNEKARKVKKQEKFPCTKCRKGVGSNSILCQFFKCWVHKRCTGVRGRLKQDDEFNCRICVIR